MDYMFVAFLLGLVQNFSAELSRKTASACYGSDGSCNYVHMKCKNGTFIHILSAQYLFNKIQACKNAQGCDNKQKHGCCNSTSGYYPGKPFSGQHLKSLNNICGMKKRCDTYPSPWTAGDSTTNTSSLIEVKYYCENENVDNNKENDNPRNGPEALQDSNNTAAIVTPIVVMLVVVIIAAVIFVYWRRRKQRQTENPPNTGNGALQRAVQNEAYLKSNTTNESATEEPENTYHTIDLNSLPDDTDGHQAPGDPGPQDVYNMIDPNKMDYETPANHDYFVLEPKAGGANEAHFEESIIDTETEYNTTNLESNKVVKDPNYHRLGSLEHNSEDKHGDVDDSYSHLETAHNTDNAKMVNKVVKPQEEILNDDYSHLK